MVSISKNFFDNPYHEDRPWGSFDLFAQNIPCTVKIITVKAGECTSLQQHTKRQEFWRIISGTGELTIGNDRFSVVPADSHIVLPETPHRISAGDTNIVLLEISTGDFDEDDIDRLEDKYNRIT